MLLDYERIAREMGDPVLVRLHRKLGRLSSVLTVMNTGAHPDDEASGMLAALRFGYGMRIVIACSTRGEGGQNGIGPERGAALAAIRTREMEEAARALDADVVWLGHGHDDPVHDFGFSKNGDDTLARWGEDRIVERLVKAYREERPDIVIPTFLDVPGQHGHHRAMTRAAEIAIARAADPLAYPQHAAEGLKPWRVAKYYLPAWSGGGTTYDDEVPPPVATLSINAPACDVATGVPFARIGEWSRAAHRTQGMGAWLENPPASWPLHLLRSTSSTQASEADIRDGLAATVGALIGFPGLPTEAADHLAAAQEAIEEAQAAFPHRDRIIEAALRAARAIENVLAAAPEPILDAIGHRLARKLRELDAVILEASGANVRAWAEPPVVAQGGKTVLHISSDAPFLQISSEPALCRHLSALRTDTVTRFELSAAADAPLTNPYPPYFRNLGGNGEAALKITAEIHGRTVSTFVDLEEPLRIVPSASLVLDPGAYILPISEHAHLCFVRLHVQGDAQPDDVSLTVPRDWRVTSNGADLAISTPPNLKPGLYRLEASIAGRRAYRSMPIFYPHIGRAEHFSAETLQVLALDVKRPPDVRIGYVGGGSDRVGFWLERLGCDVTELDDAALKDDLSRFTTLVIGTFAFGSRPALAAATTRLRRFVEGGGHVVTLYHRPSDGWDPSSTPPRRIEISSPSLRWRVTDPAAPVTILEPYHPLLTGPNRVGPEDWEGWYKERGLYFASGWDDCYVPLIALGDKGEKPLTGGLISARIGEGRHTHVSLALHHQLDCLVPGAFRLLANLVQACRS